jgi:hypothetical protein
MTDDYVLASLDGCPSLWNFYPSLEAAEKAAPEVNEKERKYSPARTYRPMKFDAFLEAKRKHYLTGVLHEITHEQYDDALNCLPPLKWEAMPGGGTRFLCLEPTDASYHAQYADYKGRYFTRTVDALDRSTWINGIECERFIEQNKERGR